jgi:hypothetical protein
MIAHLVLFRLKPGLDTQARDELANALTRAARDIPSIRQARVGSRITTGRSYEQLMRADYPFAAILEFDDVNGLRAYLDHPVHEQLAHTFFACVEDALMYDFELWETEEGIRRISDAVK